jgi:hypothetical protein
MTINLVLLAALAQAVPEPAAPSGLPPEQALASIDAKGNVTITYITCSTGPLQVWDNLLPDLEKGTPKGPVKAKVKVTNLMVTTAELPVKHVQAYTADGRPITAEKLRTLLVKERTVLVMLDGKKADPFHLQLYKEDTIILVPPANTLNPGGMGGYFSSGGSGPPPSIEELKRPPDEKRLPK